MNLKKILKFSLIYIFITQFLAKIYFLTFNIQDYGELSYFELIFIDPFIKCIVFIIFLVLLINSITKKGKYSFGEILTSVLVFLVFNYTLSYLNSLLFYHLNNMLHPAIQAKNAGTHSLLELIKPFTHLFNKPTFSIINHVFIIPFDTLTHSIRTHNLKLFFLTFIYSNILLTTVVIFYYSLYFLFEKYNKKGFYAIIPIINNLTLINITRKPIWWIIFLIIPFIRFIPKYYINLELIKNHNKKPYYALGMTLIPWYFYGSLILNKNIVDDNDNT